MKSLLIMSFALNCILGFRLYLNAQKPPLERIVLEKRIEPHLPEPIPATELKQELQKKVASEIVKIDSEKLLPIEPDDLAHELPVGEAEWQDEIDRVEMLRKKFFEKENIDPAKYGKVRKLKKEFQKKLQKIYADGYNDLSLEKRKEALLLEEDFQKNAQSVLGKEKWDKFQNFREKYNQTLLKKVRGEGAPRGFLPMDL